MSRELLHVVGRRPRSVIAIAGAVAVLAAFQLLIHNAPVELPAAGGERPIAYELERLDEGHVELTLFYEQPVATPPQLNLEYVGAPEAAGDRPRSSALLPRVAAGNGLRFAVVLKAPPGAYRLRIDGGRAFGLVTAP